MGTAINSATPKINQTATREAGDATRPAKSENAERVDVKEVASAATGAVAGGTALGWAGAAAGVKLALAVGTAAVQGTGAVGSFLGIIVGLAAAPAYAVIGAAGGAVLGVGLGLLAGRAIYRAFKGDKAPQEQAPQQQGKQTAAAESPA